jgi:hypothetical protein
MENNERLGELMQWLRSMDDPRGEELATLVTTLYAEMTGLLSESMKEMRGEPNDSVRHRIRMVRIAGRMSTRTFAAILGAFGYDFSHGTVARYERDEPPMEYVSAVSKAFSVSQKWLITGDDER